MLTTLPDLFSFDLLFEVGSLVLFLHAQIDMFFKRLGQVLFVDCPFHISIAGVRPNHRSGSTLPWYVTCLFDIWNFNWHCLNANAFYRPPFLGIKFARFCYISVNLSSSINQHNPLLNNNFIDANQYSSSVTVFLR